MCFDKSNLEENLKFVFYEEDEGFQVITSVKGNI